MISYSKAGVSYKNLDPVKKLAQKLAKQTASNLSSLDEKEISESRGESAFTFDCGDHYRAFVIEGLGTKNLVADEMEKITGISYYKQIAQDTVATIVNDLVTVGAKPEVINAYFAVGNSSWFKNEKRTHDLLLGWKKACDMASATWGGGETPTLSGIISRDTIELAGAATGVIKPKSDLILGDKLGPGDIIALVESSGIHANGLTLARSVAKKLPRGFATKMPSGKLFGDAILSPTIIYANLVRALQKSHVDIHYTSNITGHGWRKIMRHTKNLTYIIDSIPTPQEEFIFMQKRGPISNEEAYATFNMGAGFAIFINQKEWTKLNRIAKSERLTAHFAGYVKRGPRQVIIKPKNITFDSETLDLR